MAFGLKDRIRETTTVDPGSGNLVLENARVAGFLRFADRYDDGDEFYALVANRRADEWEIVHGRYIAADDEIEILSVLQAAVNGVVTDTLVEFSPDMELEITIAYEGDSGAVFHNPDGDVDITRDISIGRRVTSGEWRGTEVGPTFGGTGLTAFGRGALLVASLANIWTNLAIGTAGKFLRSDGTDAAWSTLVLPKAATRGDLPYASATDTVSMLPKGAQHTVLAMGANDPNWVANIQYGALPTGTGAWDTGGGTTITITRSLTVSGTLTGTLTGSALSLTNTRTIWGQNFNGTANVTGAMTGVTDITASGTVNAANFNGIIGATTPAAATFTSAQTTGNMTVDGDLLVSGTMTTINTDNIAVEDPLIKLATANVTDAVDMGFYSLYQPSSTPLYTGLFRDATDSKYKLFHLLQAEPTTTVNTSGTGYAVATLVANLEGNVTGGTLAGTTLALSSTATIAGTRPAYIAGGSSRVARFGQVLNQRVDVSMNMWYDGSNWNLDDTSVAGHLWRSVAASPLTVETATAGSNPRTLITLFTIDAVGAAAFNVNGATGVNAGIGSVYVADPTNVNVFGAYAALNTTFTGTVIGARARRSSSTAFNLFEGIVGTGADGTGGTQVFAVSGSGAILSPGITSIATVGDLSLSAVGGSGNILFKTATGTAIKFRVNDDGTVVSNGPFSATTIAASGDVTVTKSASRVILNGASDNSGAGIQFLGWSGVNKNWQIDTAFINGDVLSFTPSTAAGGSTFATSVLTLSTAGALTMGDGVTTRDVQPAINVTNGNAASLKYQVAAATKWIMGMSVTSSSLQWELYNAATAAIVLSFNPTTSAATFTSVNSKPNTGTWHLNLIDLTSMAAGVGAGITFNGYKTGTSAVGVFGAIAGYKANGTSANEAGGVKIYYGDGSVLQTGIDLQSTGAVAFAAGISATTADFTQGTFSGPIISNAGGLSLKLNPTAQGTYGSQKYFLWTLADATTEKFAMGYMVGDDQRFFISSQQAGGSIVFRSGNASNSLVLNADLSASFNSDVKLNTASKLYLDGGTDTFIIEDVADRVRIYAGNIEAIRLNNGPVRLPNISTTASAANAFLDGADNNNILRSTSSLRYKKNWKDMKLKDARKVVMGLNSGWYNSLGTADSKQDVWAGFTAEHIATLDDAYVTYDQEGRPDWVMYERLTVPMALVLQDHESRIAVLEKQ